MHFEWDENKNLANIAKHGISFEQAKGIFEGFTVSHIDDRFEYGEMREISIGLVDGIAVIVVVHTDRDDICRIISARPAIKHERKQYEQKIREAFKD